MCAMSNVKVVLLLLLLLLFLRKTAGQGSANTTHYIEACVTHTDQKSNRDVQIGLINTFSNFTLINYTVCENMKQAGFAFGDLVTH